MKKCSVVHRQDEHEVGLRGIQQAYSEPLSYYPHLLGDPPSSTTRRSVGSASTSRLGYGTSPSDGFSFEWRLQQRALQTNVPRSRQIARHCRCVSTGMMPSMLSQKSGLTNTFSVISLLYLPNIFRYGHFSRAKKVSRCLMPFWPSSEVFRPDMRFRCMLTPRNDSMPAETSHSVFVQLLPTPLWSGLKIQCIISEIYTENKINESLRKCDDTTWQRSGR